MMGTRREHSILSRLGHGVRRRASFHDTVSSPYTSPNVLLRGSLAVWPFAGMFPTGTETWHLGHGKPQQAVQPSHLPDSCETFIAHDVGKGSCGRGGIGIELATSLSMS